ncbi:hypothetical protein [Vibrio crassostreae]|uniref:hypothetical protein n=1 Tax=Vibrio crassostreae TaxID=246167 RepID=UPI001B3113FE|nr:hypothetical protein [Vibrio crassostreae]
MRVLVTGSRGLLGSEICNELERLGLDFFKYSKFMPLDEVDWDGITHIINCAAVVPNSNETLDSYWEGNVKFVHDLINFSSNKNFIHFSSLSEQYKFDDYQITKLLGSNLLSCNGHVFSSLQIIPVPTLEDKTLINYLIEKSKLEKITVDRLKYSFMEVSLLAKIIIQSIVQKERVNVINNYTQKDLYEEVKMHVDPDKLIEGPMIDRTSVNDLLISFSPNLLNDIHIKKYIC